MDETGITEFMKSKLEKEAKKNWDLFYKRNGGRFFKDRHWTIREFPQLDSSHAVDGSTKILLEVGCGVGNFIFPLLQENTAFFVYCCDFSPVAIDLCQQNPLNDASKCRFFVADLTSDEFCESFKNSAEPKGHSSVDVISLIFVLSAITPDKFAKCISNVSSILKPGGIVLFRDYADGDHAMTRFNAKQKISERFFVRQDGTRAFYFQKDSLESLFCDAGFEVISSEYVNRKTTNVKEKISVERTFLQASFRKI
jgi:methyltransferase-like protein 6